MDPMLLAFLRSLMGQRSDSAVRQREAPMPQLGAVKQDQPFLDIDFPGQPPLPSYGLPNPNMLQSIGSEARGAGFPATAPNRTGGIYDEFRPDQILSVPSTANTVFEGERKRAEEKARYAGGGYGEPEGAYAEVRADLPKLGDTQKAGPALGDVPVTPRTPGPAEMGGAGRSGLLGTPSAGGPAGGSAGIPGAAGGPLGAMTEEQAGEMLGDGAVALARAFQRMGIDPYSNMFARGVMQRYAPLLTELYSFMRLAQGANPDQDNLAANLEPTIDALLKRGGAGLSQQVLEMARTNPQIAEVLQTMGPEAFLRTQAATSNSSPLFARARQRQLEERLMRQRADAYGAGGTSPSADTGAWLRLLMGA